MAMAFSLRRSAMAKIVNISQFRGCYKQVEQLFKQPIGWKVIEKIHKKNLVFNHNLLNVMVLIPAFCLADFNVFLAYI